MNSKEILVLAKFGHLQELAARHRQANVELYGGKLNDPNSPIDFVDAYKNAVLAWFAALILSLMTIYLSFIDKTGNPNTQTVLRFLQFFVLLQAAYRSRRYFFNPFKRDLNGLLRHTNYFRKTPNLFRPIDAETFGCIDQELLFKAAHVKVERKEARNRRFQNLEKTHTLGLAEEDFKTTWRYYRAFGLCNENKEHYTAYAPFFLDFHKKQKLRSIDIRALHRSLRNRG